MTQPKYMKIWFTLLTKHSLQIVMCPPNRWKKQLHSPYCENIQQLYTISVAEDISELQASFDYIALFCF